LNAQPPDWLAELPGKFVCTAIHTIFLSGEVDAPLVNEQHFESPLESTYAVDIRPSASGDLILTRQSSGRYHAQTQFWAYWPSELLDDKGLFFALQGVNGLLRLRRDLTFSSEDASWNGAVTFQKGTCVRIQN